MKYRILLGGEIDPAIPPGGASLIEGLSGERLDPRRTIEAFGMFQTVAPMIIADMLNLLDVLPDDTTLCPSGEIFLLGLRTQSCDSPSSLL